MKLNKGYEIEISDGSEATVGARKESPGVRAKPATNIEEKEIISTKSKGRCAFNQHCLKDPKYAPLLRECRANKYFAHCSISKSDFSIFYGGIYLINSHVEQTSHKRFAETQAKKCKV